MAHVARRSEEKASGVAAAVARQAAFSCTQAWGVLEGARGQARMPVGGGLL